MGSNLTKSAYEGVVLVTLRRYLIEQDPGLRHAGKITVEEVRLDTSGPAHMLEILFRDDARRRCLFGWRFPATEADADALERVEYPALWEEGVRGSEQAEIWAGTFVRTNLEEEIEAAGHGLPSECDPESITWVGAYQP